MPPPVDLALPELWEWDLGGGREGGGREVRRGCIVVSPKKSLMHWVRWIHKTCKIVK